MVPYGIKVSAPARWLYRNLRVSLPKKPSAHGQAKNSIDMEWTSHPSMLGHTVEYGTRSRLVYAAKA